MLAPANTVKGSLIILILVPEPLLLQLEMVHFRRWAYQLRKPHLLSEVI